MIHPKVKVPAVVLAVLTAVCAVLTGVAGVHSVPWAATVAAGVATVLQTVIGYLTPSGTGVV